MQIACMVTFMMKILLSTERLILKDLSKDDAQDFFRYRSNFEVSMYQAFHPKSVNAAASFIENNTENFNQEETWFQTGIFLENTLIGDIGIHFTGPDNRQCEIGCTIAPEYQNKGYASEAVAKVVYYL